MELALGLVFALCSQCLCVFVKLGLPSLQRTKLMLVLAAASLHGMPYDYPHMLLWLLVHTSKPLHDDR